MLSEIQELTTDAKEIRQNGHQQEEDSVFALSYILVMLEAARKCCGARPFSVSSRATLAPDLQRKRFKFNTDFFFFLLEDFFLSSNSLFFFLFKFWSTALPRILLKCTGAYKLQILWFWIKTTVCSARIWVPKTPLFDPDIQKQKLLDLQHF